MIDLILDIGCGENKKGDVGIDFRKIKGVDIVAHAEFLPIRTESIDHVFSSHVIEHFSHQKSISILKEWIRTVKRRGIVEIECPDLQARAFLFFINPSIENIKNIYGGQDYEGNYHKTGFSYGLLKNMLKHCGVIEIRRIITGYKGIPFLPDGLHIIGYKDAI